MGLTGIRIALAITAGSALLASGEARAANGAYAVDAADISEVGSCKVESWISTATNTDFSAVANPSCVANIFRPVELSLLTNRFRSDGDWSTSIAPKAKWNIVPTGIGKLLSRLCPRLTGFPKPCGSTSMPAGCGTARSTGIT